MKRTGSRGTALGFAMALTILVGPGPVLAADAPVGKWKTVDEKSGQVTSEVELYEQGSKLFGKIIGLPELYKAEIWSEEGKLKVRGYLGPFYKTQTWLKGS